MKSLFIVALSIMFAAPVMAADAVKTAPAPVAKKAEPKVKPVAPLTKKVAPIPTGK